MTNQTKTVNGDKDVRFGERFFYLLCACPLLWMSQLYCAGICVWLQIWFRGGQWSGISSLPLNRQELGYFVVLQIDALKYERIVLLAWPFIYLLWIALLVQKRSFRGRRHGWGLLLAALGTVLMLWQLIYDPTGFGKWISRMNSQ